MVFLISYTFNYLTKHIQGIGLPRLNSRSRRCSKRFCTCIHRVTIALISCFVVASLVMSLNSALSHPLDIRTINALLVFQSCFARLPC
ncbi:hypothetical protein GALMADRAFT_878976 [Galerina marginata CBS 339.88]|uniref:Uncharacterized protein n=1 Tax=Galerina marginata (strain CBS 339.88) TaxID=685588 RepID=A0A067SSB9_GALM3|nr:hypothetical protein GALMADRAFT_878976 [Galerina marginata CBS 339.88]